MLFRSYVIAGARAGGAAPCFVLDSASVVGRSFTTVSRMLARQKWVGVVNKVLLLEGRDTEQSDVRCYYKE